MLKRFLLAAAFVLSASMALAQTSPGSSPCTIAKGCTGASTASGARTNLGVAIGTDVQAHGANLDALSAASTAADKLWYWTGSATGALIDFPSWARSVVSAASASAGRSAFGLAIGTDVQAYNANLAAISGLTTAANKLSYWTGSGTAALTDLSAFARTLLDDADAATARATLGVSIGSAVQAWDADLDAVAALSSTGMIVRTGAGTAAVRTLQAPAAGLTITNPAGTAGDPTFALANDLAALEGLSGTGLARRTGTDAWSVGAAVANSELATMANGRIKCRTTAGTGAPEDCTGTQVTALLVVCVGDSGSGGVIGMVPAPAAGDASAGKFLKADCTWAVPAGGGGGGGGMTDTERQNFTLNWIYQAKALAAYRRGVNIFADGFKGTGGINSGSSSNYTADTTNGKVSPDSSSASYPQIAQATGSTLGNMTFGGGLASAFDSNENQAYLSAAYLATVGGTGTVGKDWGSGNSKTIYKIVAVGSNDFGFTTGTVNVELKLDGSNDNSSWTNLFTVTFANAASALVKTFTDADGINVTTAYRYHRVSIRDTGGTAYPKLAELKFYEYTPAVHNNMTLVSTSQTTDSTVSNARVLIEYDNSSAPTLNTDLTASASCKIDTATVTISNASPGVITHTSHGLSVDDAVVFTTSGTLPTGLTSGQTYFVKTVLDANSYTVAATRGGAAINTSSAGSGTHTATYRIWIGMTLSAVTSYSQSSRKVAETADTACTGGTSFASRIKTFNNKNVDIYGSGLTVH